MKYPVVIHKDKDSDYGVIVPSLPGCYSAGTSYDEALNNVHEAIECHIEGILLDEDPIPMPGNVDEYINDPEFSGGIWAFVDIDFAHLSGKCKRVNITVPERVLRQIDRYTQNHDEKNRSAFIVDAALHYMNHSG